MSVIPGWKSAIRKGEAAEPVRGQLLPAGVSVGAPPAVRTEAVGLLAAGLVIGGLYLLAGPVADLAVLYGGSFALRVPAALGYGDRQVGRIPPHADLHFEIELLEVLTRD